MAKAISIDDQECFRLSKEEWANLENGGSFRGMKIVQDSRALSRLDFVEDVEELSLVLWQPVPIGRWAPLMLVHSGDRFVRARLVWTRCNQCDLDLDGADVADSELFWGTPSPEEAMEAARVVPRKECPRCGGELDPRLHLIWVRSK